MVRNQKRKKKPTADTFTNLSCSFCGKTRREVRALVVGPLVYICDECVELCNDIVAGETGREIDWARTRASHDSAALRERPLRRRNLAWYSRNLVAGLKSVGGCPSETLDAARRVADALERWAQEPRPPKAGQPDG